MLVPYEEGSVLIWARLLVLRQETMAALQSPTSMFQLPEPGEGELETNITLRVGKLSYAAATAAQSCRCYKKPFLCSGSQEPPLSNA